MTPQEALDYIESHSFSRWKLGLERERELAARLGNPQKSLSFIHVAGSNGKGSTCAMLERILREAGYKTGFFPSPYIEDFCERIRVNGENIPGEALARITERVRKEADAMKDHPTQFELITAIGFCYFEEEHCDIVVLETGLGGEYDATNIIDAPEVAVLTNIGLEHTEYLGKTLKKIATTKAGIIKKGADAVLYDNVPEVTDTVQAICDERDVPLHLTNLDDVVPKVVSLTGQRFTYRPHQTDYTLALPGLYQLHNVCTVLKVVDVLRKRGRDIPEEAVKKGLANVSWPARFEVLSQDPPVILDGGHNPQCATALASSLNAYLLPIQTDGGITFVTGLLQDKDAEAILDTLAPFASSFFCVQPDSERAMDARTLCAMVEKRGLKATAHDTVADGLKAAVEEARAKPFGCVVAFGSLYMAGDVRAAWRWLS